MDETVLKIAFGALLHDIGKFMQRAELDLRHQKIVQNYDLFCPLNQYGRPAYLHAAHTAYFIEHILPDELLDKTELYNAARHHKNQDDDLYKTADSLSAGMERYMNEADDEHFKEVRMHSIFDMVELQYAIRDREGHLNSRWKHKLIANSELHLSETYPVLSQDDSFHDGEYTYQRLWENFESEIGEISSIKSPRAYFDELYWLLEKYTCCIPSATNAFPDISLFDHSKTTAAIASALYLYEQSARTDIPEFILYGGDISGIQDYIFKISQTQGVGGIAKRLRGRSFYISMLSEVFSRYIIERLTLTKANINFCGGGNFELLLPNTLAATELLSSFEHDANDWFLEQFHGELGFVGSFVEMTKEDLRSSFAEKKDKLNDALASAKQQKYRTHINSERLWIESTGNERKRVCRSCNLNLLTNARDICRSCDTDKKTGELLPQAEYISFSKEILSDDSISFGPFGYVTLWREKPDPYILKYPIYALHEDVIGVKAIYRFARTVPAATKTLNLETEEDDEGSKIVHAGQPLSFSTLADMATGDQRIGILKMDVDNLGFIISMGLDAPSEVTSQGNLRSISRLSTLSRQMSVFFTTHLDAICQRIFERWQDDLDNTWKHKHSVSNIFYLIFAGGDDLIIVGPWDRIIELACEIRREFKNFTCHNPNVTLSAGIYLCKPKFPINHAVKKAEEALKQSKDSGRNRITVMGETAVWADEDSRSRIHQKEIKKRYAGFRKNEIEEEKMYIAENIDSKMVPSLTFEEMNKFAMQLMGYMKAGQISHGFIRTLLKAREQFFIVCYNDLMERNEEKHNLMFLPHLLYIIERNAQKEIREELKNILITSGDALKYVRQAIYPCKYVLMKTRKEKN